MKTSGNAMADINDVYAWMTSDGVKVNLALTVSPADDGTRQFGPAHQYVFHIEQHAAYGMAGTETKVLCTFATNTSGQCWVLDPAGATVDYVSGDLSVVAGRSSASGRLRVFAGRRSDPFFFNLSGFLEAKKIVNDAPSLQTDNKGCPTGIAGVPFTNNTTPATLRATLEAEPTSTTTGTPDATVPGPCPVGEKDCFADFNVMAIVVQVDKALLVDTTNNLVSVWASTHAAP